jgi:hypothetical protein
MTKASPAARSAAAALDRWRRAQSSLVKTKSTKKALTEKAIAVVTTFMPPMPRFESADDDIAPASHSRGAPSALRMKQPNHSSSAACFFNPHQRNQLASVSRT